MGDSRTVIVPVVGITFVDGYPSNIHRLRQVCEELGMGWGAAAKVQAAHDAKVLGSHANRSEGLAVVLKRNPKNEYDANAIEVHVPAIGQMIGHVGREVAKNWAPLLDGGATPKAWVEQVRVKSGHEDRPGIDIRTEWPTSDGKSGKSGSLQRAVERSVLRAADDAEIAYSPGFEPMTDEQAMGYAERADWAWHPTDEL